MVECKECSFIFVKDYPSAEFLKNFYAPTYQPDGDEFVPAGGFLRRLKYRAFTKWISGKSPKDQVIRTFEIGCGQGDFQMAVKDNPRFEAQGVDYSEARRNGVRCLSERYSLQTVDGRAVMEVFRASRVSLVFVAKNLPEIFYQSRFQQDLT